MSTTRQRRGAEAEELAARYLAESGWHVVCRNVRLSKDEIDIVAIDAGPPAELVCVEVRSARSSRFGAPEERVDARKVANLYRAARAFRRSDEARRLGLGGLPVRVDLLVVDLRGAETEIRQLRRLEPI